MTERGVVSTSGAWLTAHLGRDMGFGEGGGGEEEMASGSGLDTSTERECQRTLLAKTTFARWRSSAHDNQLAALFARRGM